MAIESDVATISAGVRHGYSLGSPIALTVANRDWENWSEEMASEAPPEGWVSARRVTVPRPGHADLAGGAKYGHGDLRNILERASARETAARVAAGGVARCLLSELGVRVFSLVVRIGQAAWEPPSEWDDGLVALARASDVSCPDAETAEAMRGAIDEARDAGDSIGGVFEVRATGVPPGLGSHVSWDRRLDARLAAALMGVPAIKGVEVGLGFRSAALPGSQVHDPVTRGEGRWPFSRPTNNAGGIEGGMSNGEPVVLRAAMKPIPTLMRPLRSVTWDRLEAADAHAERSDVCAVPAAAVVGEAVVATQLAAELLDKFGGDCLQDLKACLEAYWARIRAHWDEARGEDA